MLTRGYHVTTTIDAQLQVAADAAVRSGLATYDHRHGFRAVEQRFDRCTRQVFEREQMLQSASGVELRAHASSGFRSGFPFSFREKVAPSAG